VNHDDRHYGAFHAVINDVPRDDIRGLEHWKKDTMELHYTKIFGPTTVAKMGSFSDAKHYYLERDQLDPLEVVDEGIVAMAKALFPALEDEGFLERVAMALPHNTSSA